MIRQQQWDINSNDNTLFVTERCNNNCIMCCQPPVQADDIDRRMEENLRLVECMPDELKTVGISGGEPTLLGERLFELIRAIRKKNENVYIHLLSNGRAFAHAEVAAKLKEAAGEKIVVGVPFHSDYAGDHDLIAGAKNAYTQTIRGLYNLAQNGVAIELRIVLNRLNYRRLLPMAEFIYKNLTFVQWVALMGMEDIGYAIKNRDQVWIEPAEYASQLEAAVKALNAWDMDVAIYNVPLCLLPPSIHEFAERSISTWKVKYAKVCEGCSKKDECCGLFATSKRAFKGLKAI